MPMLRVHTGRAGRHGRPSKQMLCEACEAKCCRYFALEIDEPRTRRDFDDVRWYLCHKGTVLYLTDGDWYLHIENECRYLRQDNRCAIYADRPAICREHEPGDCEFNEPWAYDLKFTSPEELDLYVRARFR